jgi:hypothetical protein
VGFFSRKRKHAGLDVKAMTLPSGALLSIVGESHYQPALEATAAGAVRGKPPIEVTVTGIVEEEPDLPWFTALLVREPDNQYDASAIGVYSPHGKIGHLSKDNAWLYQDVLLEIERRGQQAAACSGFLRRADNGYWGAVLVLSDADACLEDLAR